MADISLYLIAIKEAIFGKDMREAIYKSIEAIHGDTEAVAESRASITEFGMVKLHASTTQGVLTNKSGLRINPETEGLMVVTKPENGVRLNGTGEIEINPADVNEAMTGTEDYKPITPVTLAGVLRAGRGVPDGSVSWAKCDSDLKNKINSGGGSGTGAVVSTDEPRDTYEGEVLPIGTIYIQVYSYHGALEVVSIYICTSDTIMGDVEGNEWSQIYPKAPTNHASTATTYGTGTNTNYGHVKLSDAINSTSDVSGGIAATPKSVKTAIADEAAARQAADTALSDRVTTLETIVANLVNHAILDSSYPSDNS